MSGAEPEEAEALAARVAFDADIEGSPTAPRENGASTFSTPRRQSSEEQQGLDEVSMCANVKSPPWCFL